MKRITLALIFGLGAAVAQADEFEVLSHDIFRPTDPLAQRDDWGLVHQGPRVNATDFAPRYHWRLCYYFMAPNNSFYNRLMSVQCRPRCAAWAIIVVLLTACLHQRWVMPSRG